MDAGRPLRSTRRLQNLTGQRPGWYRIENSVTVDGPAVISIYDEIGFFAVNADDFMRDVAAIKGDLELHINSPGGDIFDGLAIYNQLRQRKGSVGVVVDGLAASAASFIAMAASPGKLAMAPHSQMMIHDGFSMAIGNADDMRKLADLLDLQSDNIAAIYADRTGKPAAYWRDKMRAETWLTDSQAVAEGLADYVLGQERPSNAWDLSVFVNAAGQPPMETGDNGQEVPCPACDGTGVYDPDDDGDDDSTAEGDTDHDYVTADGHPGPKARLRNVKKPHGDVPYADPGYLDEDGEQASKSGKEGVARYPVDAEHVQAAWSYINQEDNAGQYTAEQLASIKSRIKSAMNEHGHEVSADDLSVDQLYAMFTSPVGAGKE